MAAVPAYLNFDLKHAISSNRLQGLWRLMTGFRGKYLAGTLSLGIASLSKTANYLLLRYCKEFC